MTDAKRGGPRGFDVVRAARALVDAHTMGDVAAASLAGVTTRSLRNWRTELETNEPLKREYLRLFTKRENAWTVERTAALRVALKQASKIAEQEGDLDKLTNFIEKVGGVDVVDEELTRIHEGSTGASREDAAATVADDEASEESAAPIN